VVIIIINAPTSEEIKKRDALFNLFSLIFCLDRIESTIKVHEKVQDKLMDDCELYVKEELSFVLVRTGINEDELAELLQENGESIAEKYSVFSTHNAYTVIENLYRKIFPYIRKNVEEFSVEDINYNLCISIILGKKVKDVTRENLPEKISENPKLLHALKLFYHLHISQDA
jgi:phosphoenolpyruvate carboxylase